MAATPQKHLVYLLDRPREPIFVPKGEDRAVFDLPNSDFLVERFRPLADEIRPRFGGDANVRIPVRQITYPDITLPAQLGRDEIFSLFIPLHQRMAARLVEIFMGMATYDEFLSVSVYCRDRVNPYMFVYALSVAILHRPDTKGLQLPSFSEMFPQCFVDGNVFSQAREDSNLLRADERIPIEIPKDYTASDLEEEHRVAYFREDLGISLHHWHWRLIYPAEGPRNIVNKDRRGELFYYMHRQIIARYNAERMCNKLGRVRRLHNFREPISEAYYPKLDSEVASRTWAARHLNAVLQDVNRTNDQIVFDIQDLERWKDRLVEAIHTGIILNEQGKNVELTEQEGIDVLGNMVESNILSVNRGFYGNLHNLGHVAISIVHDPDNRYLETFTMMSDGATAMRDPLFYRWHGFLDELFEMHKRSLPRYTTAQLDYQGVKVTGLEVNSTGLQKNQLETFWEKRDLDLSRGMDFTPRGSVFVRLTHLQHTRFTYKIQVENSTRGNLSGTVRIFMAPKFDERGYPMLFRDQRLLFIEMDKFTVELKPKTNVIERASSMSTVTIPWERTFRDLETNSPGPGAENQANNYCGCGWPENMLIPKGTEGGYPCELFVMISNARDDLVQQPRNAGSGDAASFCGIRDGKYPDKRSMGYPFDREPRTGVDILQQFLTENMMVTDVTIYHRNRTNTPPNLRGPK